MFNANFRPDDLVQGLASEAVPSFEQTSFDEKTTYIELQNAPVPSIQERHLSLTSSMGPLSEQSLPNYNVADSLLSNSQQWYKPFLTQTPFRGPMLNSGNVSPLDCRYGARNFMETDSKDGYLPHNEEVLIQNSEFEDLHAASFPNANAFELTAEIVPSSTNPLTDSKFHGIPVIISSMRGGHRCLAPDSSKCAFTKYMFLLPNDERSGRRTSTSVCTSKPMQSILLSPQMLDGGAVKLEERVLYASPREHGEAIAISDVTHSSHEAPPGVLKTPGFIKRMKPMKGNRKTVCSVCRSTFSNLYNWTVHILKKRCRRSRDKENEKIVCSSCGKKFKLPQYLYCHIKLKRCLRNSK